jgi:hypothetical protein
MGDRRRARQALSGVGRMAIRRQAEPAVRFVVLTPGRAGSTLLISMLTSAPGVRTDEEVLRTATGDAVRALRRRSVRAAVAGADAWGTAVHPEHLLALRAPAPVEFARSLHDDGYRMITLIRRNVLHHVLSAAISWERGLWHYVDDTTTSHEPIRLDVVEILRAAVEAERSAETVRSMAAGRSHLALFYEDDLERPEQHQATCDRVFRFLGLPTTEVSTPFRRRPVGLLEQIANADELLAAIAATGFARYLPDLEG